MKGWLPKKTQSDSNKNIPSNQQKKPIQINNLAFNNKSQKPLSQMTPQQEYQQLKQQFAQKQQQFQSKQKMYRIELFKNSKIKEEIQQVDKEFYFNKIKITLDLLEKNKNNKDSPLFYNQNGIAPLQLTLVEEKKYRSGMQESFVCMICFQDIENNQIVIEFPCGDNFHKDCAIQHLLGSRFCPNCNQVIDLAGHCKKKIQK